MAETVAIYSNGGKCEPVPDTVTLPSHGRNNLVVVVHNACPSMPRERTLPNALSDALGRDYRTLISIEAPGGVQRYTLETEDHESQGIVAGPRDDGAHERSAGSGLFAAFRLRFKHVLTGSDWRSSMSTLRTSFSSMRRRFGPPCGDDVPGNRAHRGVRVADRASSRHLKLTPAGETVLRLAGEAAVTAHRQGAYVDQRMVIKITFLNSTFPEHHIC